MGMKGPRLPKSWDEVRVKAVIKYYETQRDEDAIAEDDAAHNAATSTSMDVPLDLVPKVRELIARRKESRAHRTA